MPTSFSKVSLTEKGQFAHFGKIFAFQLRKGLC